MSHEWDISVPNLPLAGMSFPEKKLPKPFSLQPVKPPREHDFQRNVYHALNILLTPPGFVFSIDHANAKNAQAGALRKARGVPAGVPDMVVTYCGITLWIELKRQVGGVLSPAQLFMHGQFRRNSVPVAVCRTMDEVFRAVEAAGIPLRSHTRR